MFKRLAGSALALGLVASLLVAAPAAAEPTITSMNCSAQDGVSRDLTVTLDVAGLGESETLSTRFRGTVNSSGIYDDFHELTSHYEFVIPDALPDGPGSGEYRVEVLGAFPIACEGVWSGTAVTSFAIPTNLAPGKSASLSGNIATFGDPADLIARLQYLNDDGDWQTWVSTGVAADGKFTFVVTPPKARTVRIVVLNERGPDVSYRSEEYLLPIVVSTPTVTSKPSKIVQSTTAKLEFLYGGATTAGKAQLQRKTSSGKWVAVKTVSFTEGAGKLTWSASATYTYRLAVTPTGKSAKYSTSFKVTYKPRLTLSGPAKIKKNKVATFTLTNYLAPPATAYLQKWNGKAWVTVKKFNVFDSKVSVTAKITAKSKWRVKSGSWVSKTITVATY